MQSIAEGLAFCALVFGAVTLDIYDKDSSIAWILIIVWALFSSWGEPKKAK